MKPTFDDFMAEFRTAMNDNDPFWLIREHTRLQQVLADEMTQLADEANARNERVDQLLTLPSYGRVCEG